MISLEVQLSRGDERAGLTRFTISSSLVLVSNDLESFLDWFTVINFLNSEEVDRFCAVGDTHSDEATKEAKTRVSDRPGRVEEVLSDRVGCSSEQYSVGEKV